MLGDGFEFDEAWSQSWGAGDIRGHATTYVYENPEGEPVKVTHLYSEVAADPGTLVEPDRSTEVTRIEQADGSVESTTAVGTSTASDEREREKREPDGVRFYHGTTDAASLLAELKAVSTNTGVHPPGSFFTHEASQPNALWAASQWPISQGHGTQADVEVIEMTVPDELLASLTASGLVVTGMTPNLPYFPNQTVFYPAALPVLSEQATFRVIPGEF